MSERTMAWMLAAIVFAPCATHAADERAVLLRKADLYASEAKQYGAAGKPTTNAIAKRYAQRSQSYRAQASAGHSDR